MLFQLFQLETSKVKYCAPKANLAYSCLPNPFGQLRQGALLLFTFVLLLGSCAESIEPYQLKDEQFVNILSDMHLSESAAQQLSLSLRDSMTKVYLDQILAIHEVPMATFEPEYERLKRDPEKLKAIYAEIIKRINELKIEKGKKKEQEKLKETLPNKKR